MTDWLLIGIYIWQRPLDDIQPSYEHRIDHQVLSKLDSAMNITWRDDVNAYRMPVEWAKAIMPPGQVRAASGICSIDWWLVRKPEKER